MNTPAPLCASRQIEPSHSGAPRAAAQGMSLEPVARLHAAACGHGDRPLAAAVEEASALLRAMAA